MRRLLTIWRRNISRNAGSLLLFEALYRIATFSLIYAAAERAVRFSLKQQGYSYMTAENYAEFMRHPVTLLLIAVCGLGILAVMLVELMALLTCFEAGQREEKCSAAKMLAQGAARSLRLMRRRPLFWCFGLLAAVPAVDLYLLIPESRNLRLLSVTLQKIYNAAPNKGLLLGGVILAVLLSCGYACLLPYFFAEGRRFKSFKERAFRMAKRGFWRILGAGVCVHAAVLAATLLLYLLTLAGLDAYILLFKKESVMISAALVYGQWLNKAFGVVWGTVGFVFIVSGIYASYLVCGEPQAPVWRRKRKRTKKGRAQKLPAGKRFAAFALTLVIAAEGGYLYSLSAQGPQTDSLSRTTAAVTAHRGGAKMAPENTLSALAYSVESMSDYAEIDVQETKDGQIVLLHDNNLKRTTGMKKNIWELTLAEVEQLDAGIKFNKNFRGEKIPTLAEAIEFADGKINLNIEIKYNGHNKNIVRKVVKIITDHGFEESCVLTSMNYGFLKEAKRLNPNIRTGYTMTMRYGDLSDLTAADVFSVKHTYISEAFVEEVHALGKEIYAWTLNYRGDMKRMLDCGVDNIITDDPELVHQVLLGGYDGNPGFLELMRYMMR